jgi:hypothetical protein
MRPVKNIIALCGYPEVGKTTVQGILERRYGAVSIDDGRPLREAAKVLYGLSDWHVGTQEGKTALVPVGETQISVRKLLGDLGAYLEMSDPDHLPKRAILDAMKAHPDRVLSFGSVRRSQGQVYQATGAAVVVEIRREGCRPSAFFDEYDRSLVDIVIDNEIDPADLHGSRQRLEDAIARALDPHFAQAPEQCAAVAMHA